MKLGLPGSGKEMDKLIDPRFGRCQYFIVIDPETFSFKAKENPFKSTDRGVGIQACTMDVRPPCKDGPDFQGRAQRSQSLKSGGHNSDYRS